ncbi:DUF6371 domain-containing protein [Marinilabilia salmonicolor]|uniref:Toprim domain-containing protein n=1 Tax=Marinilabilia salmonicolor TaxID=989 RepID=A0A368VFD5_9BACT|nr:DUF6371 domain-containing protein [Marinilabilia salmonicolor]RCW38364.1 hypothetical protein DFO77_104122 [Marinilabilia salmonicolor]
MIEYTISLDKSTRKFLCPACQKKRFVRYYDSEKRQYLPENVGRCDREVKCGYHYSAGDYFKDQYKVGKDIYHKSVLTKPSNAGRPIETSFISCETFRKSLIHYDKNHFISFLSLLFDKEKVAFLIDQFKIGTSKHWPGATVFWQLDNNGKIRTGKIMLYDPRTGKRVKRDVAFIQWAHKILKLKDYNLEQCLFGLHQLPDAGTKPVAIVESEKTAVLMTGFYPGYCWMATGGLSNLSYSKMKILAGRKIFLYPDLGGWDKWQEKAGDLISKGMDVQVSTILEKHCSAKDRESGFDIADYFIKEKLFPTKVKLVQSYEDKILARLIKQNPVLKTLLDRLSLVKVNTKEAFVI